MSITKEVAEQLQTEGNGIIEQAKVLVIKTEAESMQATNLLTVIKGMQKKVNATFKPMLDSAKATLATIKGEHAKFIDPLDDADACLRQKVGQFMLAENKRREELQAKEDAKYAKKEAKAEATGKTLTVAPVIVAKVQTAPNASVSKRYYAEVVDIKALCQAVIAGTVSPDFVLPNQVLLNKLAVAMKDSFNVDGVVAKYEISTTIRGA